MDQCRPSEEFYFLRGKWVRILDRQDKSSYSQSLNGRRQIGVSLNVLNEGEFNGIHTSMTAIFAAAFAPGRAEWSPSVRLFSFVLKSSDPVHTFESTEKLAASNLAQQLHTPLVQNSRFCACLRVVHKAESAITSHHTQLGAFLKSPAGAIYFKETGNFCDSSCALGCFHLACRVQMFNDPRQKLQTGRQTLFYHNVLCIAILWSNGLYSPEKQVVTAGQREGWPQEPAKSCKIKIWS